jgi:hypothetical protein
MGECGFGSFLCAICHAEGELPNQSTLELLNFWCPSNSGHQQRRFSTGGGRAMSDTYIIEVSSKAAGIVVRDKSGYRFFAASHDFDSLEGRYFRSAREAERAAAQFKLERETRATETK